MGNDAREDVLRTVVRSILAGLPESLGGVLSDLDRDVPPPGPTVYTASTGTSVPEFTVDDMKRLTGAVKPPKPGKVLVYPGPLDELMAELSAAGFAVHAPAGEGPGELFASPRPLPGGPPPVFLGLEVREVCGRCLIGEPRDLNALLNPRPFRPPVEFFPDGDEP